MSSIIPLLLAPFLLCLWGCNSCPFPDTSEAAFSVEGSVTGSESPECATAVALWLGDVGEGDYTYKYGEGAADGDAFAVTFDDPPPDEAILAGWAGIAFVAVLPEGESLADGIVEEEEFGEAGFTMRHAVIWKPGDPSITGTWLDGFPAGWSCGGCVGSQGFDEFEPVDCGEVEIQTGDAIEETEFCEWT